MKKQANAAQAIADIKAGTVFSEIEIAAPRERVFAALTRAEQIVAWWGSAELYRTTAWQWDLRAGATWKAGGVGADGSPFSLEGELIAVDAPSQLTFTWKADWDGGHVSTVTYQLQELPGKTRLFVRHDGFAGRLDSCQGHAVGWQHMLSWLAAYLTPPAPVQYVLARLIPSRPDFAMTMTLAEKAVMGEHAAYCKSQIEQGKALLFGPVADPAGVWGLGLLAVSSEAEAQAIAAADPAAKAKLGRYQLMPLLNVIR